MRKSSILALLLLTIAPAASATELNCDGSTNVEQFRYTWRMRGGLRWIAGLVFPTSGVGNLKTVFPKTGEHTINSELLITPSNGVSGGFFAYESEMDNAGQKTLMSYSGYTWGNKSRKERTVFDYTKRLARVQKETPGKVENKVKPFDDEALRDVLTAIYYLRQNASRINGPIVTSIYEGKEYPVVFRPVNARPQQFMMEGQRVTAIGFEIADAPGGKKWPGNVKVWLSQDARRIPFRIEIQQSMASLQLDLQSIDSCGFMSASK